MEPEEAEAAAAALRPAPCHQPRGPLGAGGGPQQPGSPRAALSTGQALALGIGVLWAVIFYYYD